MLYALSLLCGFLAFCAYLKWQRFIAESACFLPLFVLASPLLSFVSFEYDYARTPLVQLALLLVLLDVARHPTLDNWVRPLRGPSGVFRLSRDARYFADMHPWHNEASFRSVADALYRAANAIRWGSTSTIFNSSTLLKLCFVNGAPDGTVPSHSVQESVCSDTRSAPYALLQPASRSFISNARKTQTGCGPSPDMSIRSASATSSS